MAPEREKLIPEKEPSQEKGIFKSETAEKIEALKRMKELVEMEGKEGVSIEEAEEILGQEDVLGPEDVENWLSGAAVEAVLTKELTEEEAKKAREKIERIPYTRQELEKAKKLGEMLVLRSPFSGLHKGANIIDATTINSLKNLYPERFSKQKEWFKDKKFFCDDKIEKWEWKLVRKEPTMLGKTYSQQEKMLAKEKNLKRRRPVEIVYDTLLYWLKNDKPPFENVSDWSSEKLSPEKIVRVGIEKETIVRRVTRIKHTIPHIPSSVTTVVPGLGIVIGSNHPDHPKHPPKPPTLGVCPQR